MLKVKVTISFQRCEKLPYKVLDNVPSMPYTLIIRTLMKRSYEVKENAP